MGHSWTATRRPPSRCLSRQTRRGSWAARTGTQLTCPSAGDPEGLAFTPKDSSMGTANFPRFQTASQAVPPNAEWDFEWCHPSFRQRRPAHRRWWTRWSFLCSGSWRRWVFGSENFSCVMSFQEGIKKLNHKC